MKRRTFIQAAILLPLAAKLPKSSNDEELKRQFINTNRYGTSVWGISPDGKRHPFPIEEVVESNDFIKIYACGKVDKPTTITGFDLFSESGNLTNRMPSTIDMFPGDTCRVTWNIRFSDNEMRNAWEKA